MVISNHFIENTVVFHSRKREELVDQEEIKRITYRQTWTIRQKVMWPKESIDYIKIPGDETGEHFGLFYKNELISVISLFEHEGSMQFRKFATLGNYQGKGFGSKLLSHTLEYAQAKGATMIWCNSRTNKAKFYEKFGLIKTAKTFEKGGIDYVIMERQF